MLVTLLKGILIRLVSEKVICGLLVELGDYLVPRTDNRLDDAVWKPVREALGAEPQEKSLEP